MFLQIAIGSVVLTANIAVAALAAFALETIFQRVHRWLLRPPQRMKLFLLLMATGLWVLAVVRVGVWIWGLTLLWVGAFGTLEEAIYFALVAYTTLGLGDLIAHPEWRILSAMAAANGLLSFGLLTALLVEALRQVRLSQIETRRRRSDD